MQKSEPLFIEIERKYRVSADQYPEWKQKIASLAPSRIKEIASTDHYWTTKVRDVVFRCRKSENKFELTLKSPGQEPDTRREVNLQLEKNSNNGEESVKAFAALLGFEYQGHIVKEGTTFSFGECEIVCYFARSGGKSQLFIEIEVKPTNDFSAACNLMNYYEKILDLPSEAKSEYSLFELFFGKP